MAALAEKVAFLSTSSAYPGAFGAIEVVETHMSFVFLAGDRAYKLKKPVRFPFLDFSTLDARRRMCREEIRLNRRLAGGVYLGLLPLRRDAGGQLALGRGDGRVVDWIVAMRRLPKDLMLDHVIESGALTQSKIDALAERLSGFYQNALRSTISTADYLRRFIDEQAKNRAILSSGDFSLDRGQVDGALDRLDARLATDRDLFSARVAAGRIVDGHGDLRPEHVCFTQPVAIFDCLEFNAALRQVDPFDELAFLGMECARLGAPSLGPALIDKARCALGDDVAPRLIGVYTAWRALLRARLSIAHLRDAHPRTPEKWAPLATQYLALAENALAQ